MPSEGVQKRKLSLTASEAAKSSTQRVVLVTGTAGFVGFHCAKALKERGDGVLGLDNFNSYYPVGLKYDRAKRLEELGVYTFQAHIDDISEAKSRGNSLWFNP